MLALEPRAKNANLQRAHDYEVNTKRLRFLLVSKTFHVRLLPSIWTTVATAR